ncbi:hypothetical protein Tsubulata_049385 [Turnera subulata]|uniref:Cytochrome P450 n=1 Tax=Turnera subulata TaxID=218843 RepID=A0A9Q0EY45_9ROSI|nr:hypothetical protein Tsubulata_049385 [Turnera subulata]
MTRLFVGPQLDEFIHIREQQALNLLASLFQKSREGMPCDLGKELTALTNSIICRMAIGKRCKENPNLPSDIRKLLQGMMEYAAKLSFTQVFGPLQRLDLSGNGKRLVSTMWEYDRLMEKIMKDYEADEVNNCQKEGSDVMDILLETYRRPNDEWKLTREHIKNFFLEIFFAGVDTTAATIEFAIMELLNNPNILEKLREEINSVVGTNRLVKESDVPNLPYLQAIVKETMRVHPSGPLLRRQCNKDSKINGYDIKAGDRILINMYAITRDSRLWSVPEKFLPERFLTNHKDGVGQIDYCKGQDFSFLPFGSGRRACPGASHGLIVTHTTLGALVQCFDWKVKDEEKMDIKLVTGYSGAMALPLVCYPITHFNPFKA